MFGAVTGAFADSRNQIKPSLEKAGYEVTLDEQPLGADINYWRTAHRGSKAVSLLSTSGHGGFWDKEGTHSALVTDQKLPFGPSDETTIDLAIVEAAAGLTGDLAADQGHLFPGEPLTRHRGRHPI